MRSGALLLPLALLAGCGKPPRPAGRDLDTLDRQLVADARVPAMTELLAREIMVDPQLVGSANRDAVRPPPRPDPGSVPPDDLGAAPDTSRAGDLAHAPAIRGACPDCDAAHGARTLGALAERQSRGSVAACAATLRYASAYADRLPAGLALYPDARVAEAAGSDAGTCRLRVVSFTSAAAPARIADWFAGTAHRAGFAADARADGAGRVLRGAKGASSFMLYLRPRAGGGSEADLVAAGG